MTPSSPPHSDAAIAWFQSSHRLIDGKPDCRYGWMEGADPPCIVKELDFDQADSAHSLLQHERAVLRALHAAGAPVPELVDGAAADRLLTRFAGLSMRVLARLPGGERTFPQRERAAAWIHFLRHADCFARAGALPTDIWAGNLVLPLTACVAGQLVLRRPVLIDHAHTVVVGMNLRRPIWITPDMPRVAPEIQGFLRDDQRRLMEVFHQRGLPLPDRTETLRSGLRHGTRDPWVSYDEAQLLQEALDSGRLNIAAAIQYAVGVELRGIGAVPRELVQRLTHADPARRFPGLPAAAEALAHALAPLPLVGEHHFARIGAAQLADAPAAPAPQPGADSRTFRPVDVAGQPLPEMSGWTAAAPLPEAPRAAPWAAKALAALWAGHARSLVLLGCGAVGVLLAWIYPGLLGAG